MANFCPPRILHLLFLIVISTALLLCNWTCWYSVLAKFLVFLVLRLWFLIVFFDISFVFFDWTCWCSVLAKCLIFLVLHLWSLILFSGVSFVLFDCGF